MLFLLVSLLLSFSSLYCQNYEKDLSIEQGTAELMIKKFNRGNDQSAGGLDPALPFNHMYTRLTTPSILYLVIRTNANDEILKACFAFIENRIVEVQRKKGYRSKPRGCILSNEKEFRFAAFIELEDAKKIIEDASTMLKSAMSNDEKSKENQLNSGAINNFFIFAEESSHTGVTYQPVDEDVLNVKESHHIEEYYLVKKCTITVAGIFIVLSVLLLETE